MHKKLILFVTLLTLLITGCSNEAAEESVQNETEEDINSPNEVVNESDADQEEVVTNQQDNLQLVSHVEQLGMESFSEEGLVKNPDLKKRAFISEIDGLTYIVSYLYSADELVISIIDHGDFIVKEQPVKLSSLIGEDNQIGSIGINGNHILLTAYPISLQYETKQILSIKINEDGTVSTSYIDENVPKNTSFKLIKGLDGSYFKLGENDNQTILNVDGTELYSHSTDGSYPDPKHYEIHFFDEHEGKIYFREESDLDIFDTDDAPVIAYDLVWDDSGDSKVFDLQSSKFTHFVAGDGGYYIVRPLSLDELQVSFYMIENEDFVLKDQIEVPMTLEVAHRLFDVDIALGEQSLNVYVNVPYKGKPTVQKYMFTRVSN